VFCCPLVDSDLLVFSPGSFFGTLVKLLEMLGIFFYASELHDTHPKLKIDTFSARKIILWGTFHVKQLGRDLKEVTSYKINHHRFQISSKLVFGCPRVTLR
jgi:hypothetical protein